MPSSDSNSDVDKRTVWSWWGDQATLRNELDDEMARKALDIPRRSGISTQHITNAGMGWKELAVIGGLVLGGAYGLLQMSKPDTSPPAVQQPSPVDSEYEVRFYDSDGNVIPLPHVSERQAGE